MQISASRRVVGRIGQHAVKASGCDFRVRLPQIAADDVQMVGKSVFLGIFLCLTRGSLLNFNAAYAQCLIRAQQQNLESLDESLKALIQKAINSQETIQQNMNQTRTKILG